MIYTVDSDRNCSARDRSTVLLMIPTATIDGNEGRVKAMSVSE